MKRTALLLLIGLVMLGEAFGLYLGLCALWELVHNHAAFVVFVLPWIAAYVTACEISHRKLRADLSSLNDRPPSGRPAHCWRSLP